MSTSKTALRTLAMTVAVTLLAHAVPSAASAEPSADGRLSRGAAETAMVATLQNTSTAGESVEFLRLVLNRVGSVSNPRLSGVTGSCTIDGGSIRCAFPQGWAAGQTIRIEYDTDPRTPDGAGAGLFICARPCDNVDLGPFDVSGPPGASLRIGKTRDSGGLGGHAVGHPYTYFIGVENTGTEPAVNVRVGDRLPEGLALLTGKPDAALFGEVEAQTLNASADTDRSESFRAEQFRRFCRFSGSPPALECMYPRLDPGQSIVVTFFVIPTASGVKVNAATASADGLPQVDASESVTVTDPSDSRIGNGRLDDEEDIDGVTADGFDGAAEGFNPEGERFDDDSAPIGDNVMRMALEPSQASIRRLSRLARVEVAVRQIQGRGRRCVWLRDTRARFVAIRPRNGRCNRGRWLRASGTSRWRLRMRRVLPPGRYVAYSRAVNRGGAHEVRFSRADGNMVQFRVRARR